MAHLKADSVAIRTHAESPAGIAPRHESANHRAELVSEQEAETF